jgi:hypothetical protein
LISQGSCLPEACAQRPGASTRGQASCLAPERAGQPWALASGGPLPLGGAQEPCPCCKGAVSRGCSPGALQRQGKAEGRLPSGQPCSLRLYLTLTAGGWGCGCCWGTLAQGGGLCRPSQPLDGKKDRLHFTTGSAQPAPSGHLCCPQKAQRPYILRRGSVDFSCPPTWWCRFGSFFCTVLPALSVSLHKPSLYSSRRTGGGRQRPPHAPPARLPHAVPSSWMRLHHSARAPACL